MNLNWSVVSAPRETLKALRNRSLSAEGYIAEISKHFIAMTLKEVKTND